MREVKINKNDAGQRFDRFVQKYLNKASNSFVQRMIRKKNIELNRKRAKANTIVEEGDRVQFFLAESTIEKFREEQKHDSYKSNIELDIVYEDENILLVNKPAGLLSHSNGEGGDLNTAIVSYLIETKSYSIEKENTFVPSIVNRLDKNTEGLVLAGKNIESLRALTKAFRNNKIRRFYNTIVSGNVKDGLLEDYVKKDESENKMFLADGGDKMITRLKNKKYNGEYSFLEVELLTGRTHQIRVHLESKGNFIIGDPKYGDRKINDLFKANFNLEHQWLVASKVEFKEIEGFEYLNNRRFETQASGNLKNIYDNLFGG